MEGSPYQKFSFSWGKGAVLGTGPGVLRSGEPGCLLAGTHRPDPLADVMPVLLKSGQSASREEAVEETKDCRSMKKHWCRSTVMPEYGMSIFYDRARVLLGRYVTTETEPSSISGTSGKLGFS
ncbi:hypothetical protein F2Q69_00013618 [Brassica cretica]|uniref:Uncharacterized protein n=1 Tax=Brassica cretica TaxID=69181 RepID=A0A8S9QNB6_BRACR|nr:hypothetical protein F2Q69_00013618 [Brassica cretica]